MLVYTKFLIVRVGAIAIGAGPLKFIPRFLLVTPLLKWYCSPSLDRNSVVMAEYGSFSHWQMITSCEFLAQKLYLVHCHWQLFICRFVMAKSGWVGWMGFSLAELQNFCAQSRYALAAAGKFYWRWQHFLVFSLSMKTKKHFWTKVQLSLKWWSTL